MRKRKEEWVNWHGRRINLTLLGLIAYASAVIFSISIPFFPKNECETEDITLFPSSAWQINSSKTNARIVWQLAQQTPPTAAPIGFSNSGIAASEKQVVYWQETGSDKCDERPAILAFDLLTGEKQWQLPRPPSSFNYSSYGSVFRSMKAIPDGYIVISGDHRVFRLDYDGQIVWMNAFFPSRSIETISLRDSELYIPSHSKVYNLSLETGRITNTLEIENVVGFFGDIALVGTEKQTVQVIDYEHNQERFSIGLDDPTGLYGAASNLWPFADVFRDILLIYNSSFTPTQVTAYDVTSGKSLWTWNQQLNGLPIIANDYLIAYSKEGLGIYHPENGQLLEQISLVQTENHSLPTEVWLATNGNFVIVNFRETEELIALEIDFSKLDSLSP